MGKENRLGGGQSGNGNEAGGMKDVDMSKMRAYF